MAQTNYKSFLCAGTKALKGLKEAYLKTVAQSSSSDSYGFEELDQHSRILYPFEKQSIYRNAFGRTLNNRGRILLDLAELEDSSYANAPITTQILFFSSTNALNLSNKTSDNYKYFKQLLKVLLFPEEELNLKNFRGQQPIYFVFPGRTTHQYFVKYFQQLYHEIISERYPDEEKQVFFVFNDENYTVGQFLQTFTVFNENDSGFEGSLEELIEVVFNYFNNKHPGKALNVDFLIDTSMSSTIQHGKSIFKVCASVGLLPDSEYQNRGITGPSGTLLATGENALKAFANTNPASSESSAQAEAKDAEKTEVNSDTQVQESNSSEQEGKVNSGIAESFSLAKTNKGKTSLSQEEVAEESEKEDNKNSENAEDTADKNNSEETITPPVRRTRVISASRKAQLAKRRAQLAKTLEKEEVKTTQALANTKLKDNGRNAYQLHDANVLPLIFFALDESFRQIPASNLKELYEQKKFLVDESGEFIHDLSSLLHGENKERSAFFSQVELRWMRKSSGRLSLRIAKLASYFTIPAWSPNLLANIRTQRLKEKTKETRKHNTWIFTESRPFIDALKDKNFNVSFRDHFLLPQNAQSKEVIKELLGNRLFKTQVHFANGVNKEEYLKTLLHIHRIELKKDANKMQ